MRRRSSRSLSPVAFSALQRSRARSRSATSSSSYGSYGFPASMRARWEAASAPRMGSAPFPFPPDPALAAALLDQLDALDHHAAIDRLPHVVDGEESDLHGGERFHLDAGATLAFRGGHAVHAAARLVDLEFDGDARERDRM